MWRDAVEIAVWVCLLACALVAALLFALGIRYLFTSAGLGVASGLLAGGMLAAVACAALWRWIPSVEERLYVDMDVQPASAWEEYRTRRWSLLNVFIGGFAFMSLLASTPLAGVVFLVLAPIWGLALVVASLRLQLFECPRCHRPFFTTWWYTNVFARRCVHCGLPKWSEENTPTEETTDFG